MGQVPGLIGKMIKVKMNKIMKKNWISKFNSNFQHFKQLQWMKYPKT